MSRHKCLSLEQIERASQQYDEGGWTLKRLAAEHGVSTSTMHYAIHPTIKPKRGTVLERLERIERRLGIR